MNEAASPKKSRRQSNASDTLTAPEPAEHPAPVSAWAPASSSALAALRREPFLDLPQLFSMLPGLQLADRFVKLLRVAVRDGEATAAFIPGRVAHPDSRIRRRLNNMLVRNDPAFKMWMKATVDALAPSRPHRGEVSRANILKGTVDFDALARQTRESLQAQLENGRKLNRFNGQLRKKTR